MRKGDKIKPGPGWCNRTVGQAEGGVKMLKYEPIGRTIPSPAEERERYIAALEKKVCQLGVTCLSLIVIVIVLAVL